MEGKKATKNSKIKKVKLKILSKKKKPVFRGRFGNRSQRRKSNERWDKWRVPRGMDIKVRKDDGCAPDVGYRTPKDIRYLHPCGMNELIVKNVKDVENAKDCAVRISSTVGKKKRQEILKKAQEKGLKVLNG